MNNIQNNMVHYRIKSTAKSQKHATADLTVPLMCTAAMVFSVVSASASLAICRKIRKIILRKNAEKRGMSVDRRKRNMLEYECVFVVLSDPRDPIKI